MKLEVANQRPRIIQTKCRSFLSAITSTPSLQYYLLEPLLEKTLLVNTQSKQLYKTRGTFVSGFSQFIFAAVFVTLSPSDSLVYGVVVCSL